MTERMRETRGGEGGKGRLSERGKELRGRKTGQERESERERERNRGQEAWEDVRLSGLTHAADVAAY